MLFRSMTKGLKLRDQADVELLTQPCKPSRSVACNRIWSPPEFRVRLEREVVINLENDDVDSLLRECVKILSERIECSIGVVIEEVYCSPGFRLF